MVDRDTAATPPLEAVQRLYARLAENGIEAALGGSGMLVALGLSASARDWDVTTDADPAAVEAVLAELGWPYKQAPREAPFATAACFRVDVGGHSVDVLVQFALASADGVIHIATRRCGIWHGLPVGDAREWACAYRLMGRLDAADALQQWAKTTSN